MDTSYIVLAGGRGKRLGREKLSEVIAGKTLFERVLSCLSSFNGKIIVVKARGQDSAALKDHPGLRSVEDIYPGKGPLGGIYTGLTASASAVNLVVAGDMPFLNRDLIRYMLGGIRGFDVVVPRIGDMVEPLHAVYSRSCLDAIRSLLDRGVLMVHRLLPLLRVRYIEQDEVDKFDPAHLSFFNINTQADLARAQQIAQETHANC